MVFMIKLYIRTLILITFFLHIGAKLYAQEVTLVEYQFASNGDLNPETGSIGSPSITKGGSIQFSGSYGNPFSSLYTNGDAQNITIDISTTGYKDIKIEWDGGFWFGANGGKHDWLLSVNSGSGYGGTILTQNCQRDQWVNVSEPLSNAFDDNPNVSIRITSDIDNGRFVYLDNLIIKGTPLSPDTTPPVFADNLPDITMGVDPGQCTAFVNYNTPIVTDDRGAFSGNLAGYTSLGSYNGHSYYLSDATELSSDAADLMYSLGGHLLTVNSSAENDFLRDNVNVRFWMGLTDQEQEGTFKWVTGEALSYSNWASGEPNDYNGNEDWVEMYDNGTWNDMLNNYSSRFVIEFEGPQYVQTEGLISGSQFPVGTTTVTFEATDAAGNTGTKSFTVTVTENIAPNISCNTSSVWNEDFDSYPNFTAQATNNGTIWQGEYTGINHKAAVVGGRLEMWVESTDVSWTTNYIDISSEESVQVSFDLSSWDGSAADGYIEFWARVDADLGGTYQLFETINGAAVDQVVTSPVFQGDKLELWIRVIKGSTVGIYYVDNINLMSFPIKSVDVGQCTYSVQGSEFDAIATDNCTLSSLIYNLTGATTGTGTSLGGVSLNQGLTTITWTATDAAGNTADCSFDITIEDKFNPIAICKDITVALDGSGNASIVASDVDNSSSDNCAIANMTVNPNTFDCSDVGVNVVSFTVTDVSGNSTSCNANVTVTGTPDNSLAVVGDTKCDGEDAVVIIQNSEINVTYSLYSGAVQVGSSINGTGADLSITIPTTDLVIGSNTIIVRASKGACELDLTNNATVVINPKPSPEGIFHE